MRKGKADVICDGKTGIVDSCLIKRLETLGTNTISLFSLYFYLVFEVTQVSTFGSPRRCGGQGDILSGRSVTF